MMGRPCGGSGDAATLLKGQAARISPATFLLLDLLVYSSRISLFAQHFLRYQINLRGAIRSNGGRGTDERSRDRWYSHGVLLNLRRPGSRTFTGSFMQDGRALGGRWRPNPRADD